MDGDFENPSINLHRHYIRSDNICELFHRYKVPKELGYLSVDLDSQDPWILRQIFLCGYRPSTLTVEYNVHVGCESFDVVPRRPEGTSWVVLEGTQWLGDQWYSGSLNVYESIGAEFGYEMVHITVMLDVHLVRSDLLGNATRRSRVDLRSVPNTCGGHLHRPINLEKYPDRIWVDYRTELANVGKAGV